MPTEPVEAGQIEVVFLGSGTSQGIPMIGCRCNVCRSDDPRDKRNRASVALRLPADEPTAGRVIMIDVSPEMRLACVANDIRRVDAVLLTHAHADHIMGMDDIRRFNDMQKRQIPCYASADWLALARNCFSYADHPFRTDGWPSVGFETIDGPREICGVTVLPLPVLHGSKTVLGYRIGGLAYVTDCSAIPQETLEMMKDLDVLVLDALRYSPHFAHFNIPQALEMIARIRPRRAFLTHLTHEVLHERTSRELPAGVELAYDGLRVRAKLP